MRRVLASVLLMGLGSGMAGCGQYGYPYHPKSQPLLSPVFADYREQGEVVDILVDTHGRRLEGAWIVTNGTLAVKPTSIDQPKFESEIIGGMAGWRDPRYGVERAQGPTVLHFDRKAIGPAPWVLEVEILGVGRVSFSVGKRGTRAACRYGRKVEGIFGGGVGVYG